MKCPNCGSRIVIKDTGETYMCLECGFRWYETGGGKKITTKPI